RCVDAHGDLSASETVRIIVVGGGILGLATVRLISTSVDGAEVVVIEKDEGLARHHTGHNSGVAHAGLYYTPGSLKARLCRRGLGLLREYCDAAQLRCVACGKVVAATERREVEPLRKLAERADANGVPGLRWLEGDELVEVEPEVRAIAGLHSPQTPIVDFVPGAHAVADDGTAAGGETWTSAQARRIAQGPAGVTVELEDGSSLGADRVIVCAGLYSDRLARASGEPSEPRIVPFRGEYWQLRRDRTDLVRGLIYPVPDPRLPFLGVHLTRKVDGSVWLGPNAVLSSSREGYGASRVNAPDL